MIWKNSRFILKGDVRDSAKMIKNHTNSDADGAVYEVLKYGGSEVRDKLFETANMTFEKREARGDFRENSIKTFYNKGDKSKYGN